jgi:putative tryptophan/tyrosine transport system substrate-binding protein
MYIAGLQVELLHELVPKSAIMAFLINPSDPNAESDIKETEAAAHVLGRKLVVVKASAGSEIDPAGGPRATTGAALFVIAEVLFTRTPAENPRVRLTTICSRSAPVEGFAADGGLISLAMEPAFTMPIVNSVSTLVGSSMALDPGICR